MPVNWALIQLVYSNPKCLLGFQKFCTATTSIQKYVTQESAIVELVYIYITLVNFRRDFVCICTLHSLKIGSSLVTVKFVLNIDKTDPLHRQQYPWLSDWIWVCFWSMTSDFNYLPCPSSGFTLPNRGFWLAPLWTHRIILVNLLPYAINILCDRLL